CLHFLLQPGNYFPCHWCLQFPLPLSPFLPELHRGGCYHFFCNGFKTLLLFEDLTKTLFNVFTHCLFFVQWWFLLQNADGSTWIQECLTVGRLVQTSHNLQNRRLTRAVGTYNTNLCAWVESHGDIVQNDLVADSFTHVFHRIDELAHVTPLIFEFYHHKAYPTD